MSRGGNAYSPAVQLLVGLDLMVVSAHALPLAYQAADAEVLEDTAREWLGQLGLLATRSPEFAHLRPHVERAIEMGRIGDTNADRAVMAHSGELQRDGASTREAARALLDVPRNEKAAAVFATPAAA